MSVKFADDKGRLLLGSRFAGKMFLVEEREDSSLLIVPALAIPEREAWLYQNPTALNLVQSGLEEACTGQFVDAPDLAAAHKLAAELDDGPV